MDQMAAIPVTDKFLEAWATVATNSIRDFAPARSTG